MSNLNGGLSGSGLLRGALGGGGVAPPQDVYWDDILDKPDFATVATSGSYNDLTDKPTIPAAQVNADWNATSGVAEILNKPTLATVATSGSYNDLTDTPTIPPAQVNADWNATSGVAEILNKPTIPTTASQIEYDNTTSGLTATDTQEAIDENAAEITTIKSNLTDLEYTLVDAKYGNVAMNLPTNWKELVVYFRYGNSNGLQAQVIQGSLLRIHAQNSNFTYAVGSGTISAQFIVNTNDNTITMTYFAVGTTAYTATSQMTVYARN